RLVERLIEEAGAVLEARDGELGRQAELEREAPQQPLGDAVHGADQRLGGLLRERDEAALDQPLAHALAQLGRRLYGERRADHARGREAVADERVLELLREAVGLAAARARADESHVREAARRGIASLGTARGTAGRAPREARLVGAHAPGPQPVSPA